MSKPTPAQNFFDYVNQEWIDENPIPSDQSSWGSFLVVRDLVLDRQKELLEKTDNQILRTLWDQLMSSDDHTDKVLAMLKDIDHFMANQTYHDIPILMASLDKQGITTWISFAVYADQKQSSVNRLYFGSSGLNLPERDYYFDDDKAEIRLAYVRFLKDLFGIYSLDWCQDLAEKVLDYETILAKATLTSVERRDPIKCYNILDQDLYKMNYSGFFKELGMTPEKVIVDNPEFLNCLDAETDPDVLKAWLYSRVLIQTGAVASDQTHDLLFDFYQKKLQGQSVCKPRWKRTLMKIDELLGEFVSKEYVSKYFPIEYKNQITKMVGYIIAEFGIMIDELSWMSAETKEKAKLKLGTMRTKLGYPDKWRDYSDLTIDNNNLMKSLSNINRFEWNYQVSKIDQNVDRDLWHCYPHMVNAFYDQSFNDITFPCGILNPPFFYGDKTMLHNFSAIGCIIGHEISHAFDDAGSKYDAQGNLSEWWTETDRTQFETKVSSIVDQFNQLKIHGASCNGKLTAGENIADYCGVKVSFRACQKYYGDAWTKDMAREFFVNYAKMWCMSIRKERVLNLLAIDPHSTPLHRVNMPVSNLDAWYEAYDIDQNDLMYIAPEDRVSIW